jgi:predicted NUDIX family NTP pyrophosphohydrolase
VIAGCGKADDGDDMPPKLSAGILLYRITELGAVEVLIAHMGGPLWQRKDAGAWSIPKGEHMAEDDALQAARREFQEELGVPVPASDFVPLGNVTQAGGKVVSVWAAGGDFDPRTAVSNTFEMEWPKGSGRMRTFPEVDRVAWYGVAEARARLVRGQLPFLDRLAEALQGQHRQHPDRTIS